MVGLTRLELVTSRLSGVRSNHLSYRPARKVLGYNTTDFIILATAILKIFPIRAKPQDGSDAFDGAAEQAAPAAPEEACPDAFGYRSARFARPRNARHGTTPPCSDPSGHTARAPSHNANGPGIMPGPFLIVDGDHAAMEPSGSTTCALRSRAYRASVSAPASSSSSSSSAASAGRSIKAV